MKQVILDVDTGIDDALAIAYALHSQELDLLALTTCYGNIAVDEATRNSLCLTDLLGKEVPVYTGAAMPLSGIERKAYSTHVHGDNGIGNAVMSPPKRKAAEGHAADYMIEMTRSRPKQITLIMVGPLTNLALAIQKDPQIVELVEQVVIMGGAVRVPGNVTPVAEANIFADPLAAELVFQSGIPITLVGLDVTMQTLLPRKQLQVWKEHGSVQGAFMSDMTTFYMDFYESCYPGIGGCGLHDPLAVGVVINPDFVTLEKMHVKVITSGDEIGRTVEVIGQEPNMQVCVAVEKDKFLGHFLSRVIK